MVVLRPTKKALVALGIRLDEGSSAPASTAKLGDWHLNVVPTAAGELFVFVSASTLLAVAIPATNLNVLHLFAHRVANLLAMLGYPSRAIDAELRHFRDIAFAKPANRNVQGSANEIALQLQGIAEDSQPGEPLSLSRAELYLAQIIHSPLDYRMPCEVAFELLATNGDFEYPL